MKISGHFLMQSENNRDLPGLHKINKILFYYSEKGYIASVTLVLDFSVNRRLLHSLIDKT